MAPVTAFRMWRNCHHSEQFAWRTENDTRPLRINEADFARAFCQADFIACCQSCLRLVCGTHSLIIDQFYRESMKIPDFQRRMGNRRISPRSGRICHLCARDIISACRKMPLTRQRRGENQYMSEQELAEKIEYLF